MNKVDISDQQYVGSVNRIGTTSVTTIENNEEFEETINSAA